MSKGTTECSSIGQPNKPWEDMSQRSKNVYINRATEAIVSVLDVITPGDASNLWEAVQSSHSVDKVFGVLQPTERQYLEALADAYQNAGSWDTRRHILAIMSDLVTFRQIQKFIPRLTRYRFQTARVHILKHGRGTPVLKEKSPRIRIDPNQLDHFLSFITSSHVVQDLPFGQRYLHLSNGQVLETPNVIRLMIPQRIINQYTQFCHESNVKVLSPSTMYRILSVCTATVRKSLQGLDYLSADGAKGFDDLTSLINQLPDYGQDKTWIKNCEGMLKRGKQYIKNDYKVCLQLLQNKTVLSTTVHEKNFIFTTDKMHKMYKCIKGQVVVLPFWERSWGEELENLVTGHVFLRQLEGSTKN